MSVPVHMGELCINGHDTNVEIKDIKDSSKVCCVISKRFYVYVQAVHTKSAGEKPRHEMAQLWAHHCFEFRRDPTFTLSAPKSNKYASCYGSCLPRCCLKFVLI